MLCLLALTASAQKSFVKRLQTERVESTGPITWTQTSPGNAGFANMMRYHPTIPQFVTQCPDMWNIYQSENNGDSWYSIKDYDGNGDFYHIRELLYSHADPDFGVAIESSRHWYTEDRGKAWNFIPNCPWYKAKPDGTDQQGWFKKVASLGLDPNDKMTWYVGGGANVRQQEWLSCYKDITINNPHGKEERFTGKLWKTTNGGKSWKEVTKGLHDKAQVGVIIVNPANSDEVYAASNYGLFKSTNGGGSWKNISEGKLDNNIIMDMDYYYDKESKELTLYLIDQVQYLPDGQTTKCNGGIYMTSNGGKSFTKMNGDLALDINRLSGGVPKNYYQYIGIWFEMEGKNNYFKGQAAKKKYPKLPTAALQCFSMISADPSRKGAVYIGFADPQIGNSIMPGRLWVTENDGKKWINTARLYQDAWERDKEYWIERGNPYNENMEVGHYSPHMRFGTNYALRSMRGLDVGVDGSVMIVSDHSTMLSTDHGKTWKQKDEVYTESGAIIGTGNSNLPGLIIHQDKRLESAVLGSGEHRVWIPTDDSPDDRIALKYIESPPASVISIASDPYDGQTVYGTSSRQEDKQFIFKSTDGGHNWAKHGTATPATNKWLDDMYTNGLCVDPINSQYMYHGITKIVNKNKGHLAGFYRSEDGGKTFQQSNKGLPAPVRISDIKFDPRDESRKSLFAAAQKSAFVQERPNAEGGLYYSSDRGLSWKKVKTPAQIDCVMKMAFDHSGRLYITTGYRQNGQGLWYTDDFGKTWVQAFAYAGTRSIDISPFDRNLVVVTTEYMAENPGVFISRDRGKTWAKSNKGLGTPHKIEDIKFDIYDPKEIWSATKGCGFYKGKMDINDPIQVVKVEKGSIELSPGATSSLSAQIIAKQYASQKITWKSENETVVKFNKKGELVAIGKGNTKVWATTADGRFADHTVVTVK